MKAPAMRNPYEEQQERVRRLQAESRQRELQKYEQEQERRAIVAGLARAARIGEKFDKRIAVCLLGPERPYPRDFGDNRGALPVRIVIVSIRPHREKSAENMKQRRRFERRWGKLPRSDTTFTDAKAITDLNKSDAVRKYANAQAYHQYVVLEHVCVPNRKEADRLKAALDACLHGQQKQLGNDDPLNQYRDVLGCWDDPDTRGIWWSLMLNAASDRDKTTKAVSAQKGRRGRRR
jgi:hypothetical protein